MARLPETFEAPETAPAAPAPQLRAPGPQTEPQGAPAPQAPPQNAPQSAAPTPAPSDSEPPPKLRTRSVNWPIAASPAGAWRMLSDVALLNETLRSPAFHVEDGGRASDPDGVWMRAADGPQRWRDAPMEWMAGAFWRAERVYDAGPARRVAAMLHMEPDGDAGARVFYQVEIEPRGLMGRLYAASGLMEDAAQAFRRAAQALETVGRRRDLSVAAADFTRLLGADYAKPAAQFLTWAATATDADWADFGPEDLAPRLGVSRRVAASLCFAAARLGMIQRRFDLVCPCCQTAAASAPLLQEIPDSALCSECGATATATLCGSVRARFGASPSKAGAPSKTPQAASRKQGEQLCANKAPRDASVGGAGIIRLGPRDRPAVLARARLGSSERFTVDAPLPPGPARARIDGTQIFADFTIDRLGEAPLIRFEGDSIRLHTGAARQPLEMINAGPAPILAHLERLPTPGDRFSAAEALCLQSFRDMFPRDRPAPGSVGDLGTVAVLVALTDDLPELCDRLGDPQASRLLARARADCLAVARACGGALIRLRDDSAAFVFAQPGDALFAAEALHGGGLKAMTAAWTDLWGGATRPALRIGAATAETTILGLDDGLGHVGAAPLAARALAEQVRPGEALLEEPILAYGRAADRAAMLAADTIGVREGCGLARRFRF